MFKKTFFVLFLFLFSMSVYAGNTLPDFVEITASFIPDCKIKLRVNIRAWYYLDEQNDAVGGLKVVAVKKQGDKGCRDYIFTDISDIDVIYFMNSGSIILNNVNYYKVNRFASN